jgi:hypothetical protein
VTVADEVIEGMKATGREVNVARDYQLTDKDF